MINKKHITRALREWEDYDKISIDKGNVTEILTDNAKKLLNLLKKNAEIGDYEIIHTRSSNAHGDETTILLASYCDYSFQQAVIVDKILSKFCKSIGYKRNKKKMFYDNFNVQAIYTLKDTESFCSYYTNKDYVEDGDFEVFLILVKLRENI